MTTATAQLLDRALVALATGDRRMLLELVRDQPGPLEAMAQRLGMSPEDVSRDLAMFHALEHEEALERLTAGYDAALLHAAGLGHGDRVLDIGCGTGPTSRAAARAVAAGSVLGVDVSAAMVRRARARAQAEGLANVAYEKDDVTTVVLDPGSFDVAISRFGAMYFGHPVTAFTNVARALRPGGRLALVAWRDASCNEWMTDVAEALARGRPLPERPAGTPGAFGLADAGHLRRILGEAGFAEIDLEEHRRAVNFGPDGETAYAMVSTQDLARQLLDGLDVHARKEALTRLRAVLDAHEGPDGVLFGSSAWIITARRR